MLKDMTVQDYTALLASDAPAPGGGSAAALLGAQGLALVRMAALLTLGRKKYADAQALCSSTAADAEALTDALLMQADRDTAAYLAVSEAYRLPREPESAAMCRQAAIAKATLHATETPLSTLSLCHDGLELATHLTGHFNTNAASDLACGGEALYAGARGAYYNVKINLPSLQEPEAKKLLFRADALLSACADRLAVLRELL